MLQSCRSVRYDTAVKQSLFLLLLPQQALVSGAMFVVYGFVSSDDLCAELFRKPVFIKNIIKPLNEVADCMAAVVKYLSQYTGHVGRGGLSTASKTLLTWSTRPILPRQ